jgi:hypothetical protein
VLFQVDAGPSWCRILARSTHWISGTARIRNMSSFEFGRRGDPHRTSYREKWSQLTRLLPVLVGRRNLSQQTLEKCNFRGRQPFRRQRRLSVVKWSN